MAISMIPGLFLDLDDSEQISPNIIIDVVKVLEGFIGTDFTQVSNILGSLPTTVTFEDIQSYLNEKRIREKLDPNVSVEIAITTAKKIATKLISMNVKASVVLPEAIDVADIDTAAMAQMIINGANGVHRVIAVRGGTGIGKTQMVHKAAELAHIDKDKFGYWSLSTLAPEDFAGVPFPDDDGVHFRYLMPRGIDHYEVYFFDEFNRANPKVHNAIMQLMLDKSINGMKFPNVKAIFCAMNMAEDGDFGGVEDLDQAVEERFDHIFDIKTRYSAKIIGDNIGNLPLAEIGVKWLNNLSKDLQNHLNPRRLEKILRAYNTGESIETTIDQRKHPLPLDQLLKMLSAEDILTMDYLIKNVDKIDEEMLKTGQHSADLKYRFVELAKVMHRMGMRKEFVDVSSLFRHIKRDMLPVPDRERSYWGFIGQAMDRNATIEQKKAFFDMLKERQSGRDAVASQIQDAANYLRNVKDTDEAKKAI